jgi:4-amino-4-deoxy-L-arabinose transferase-like glycosyltransferase
VCLALFFFSLGDRALWDIDEGKHATTSQDMVLSGDWLTPEYNSEKFYDKPPLNNWLVAVSFLIFGMVVTALLFFLVFIENRNWLKLLQFLPIQVKTRKTQNKCYKYTKRSIRLKFTY